jgi:uncharacterized protein
MSRLIFIIVIIALVYWLFKSYRRQPPRQDEPAKTQDMVSCAHCGINLPKNESLSADGKYYCCAAHSRGQSDSRADK